MGGHYFLDYISFRLTCIMIAYVLREVMLCCRKMSYGRSCIGGVHVFRMSYLTICCVLLKDMPYWGSCFMRVCITGGHILQDDILYRGTPLI